MTRQEINQTIKAIRKVYNAEPFDIKAWNKLSSELASVGICPSCITADEPMRSRLLAWKPGSAEQYAGRECPNCEEFFPCGEQPEYNNEPDCFSDADQGL